MNIKLGDFVVKSDPMQLWIERERVNDKGKLTSTRVAGYCPTFKMLLEDWCQVRYRSSGATDVTQLLEDMTQIESDLKQMIEKSEALVGIKPGMISDDTEADDTEADEFGDDL